MILCQVNWYSRISLHSLMEHYTYIETCFRLLVINSLSWENGLYDSGLCLLGNKPRVIIKPRLTAEEHKLDMSATKGRGEYLDIGKMR
jgi:hypothetical protein